MGKKLIYKTVNVDLLETDLESWLNWITDHEGWTIAHIIPAPSTTRYLLFILTKKKETE